MNVAIVSGIGHGGSLFDYWQVSRMVDERRFLNIAPADGPSWLSITDKAESEAAEVLIFGQIGKDWLDNSGVDANEFRAAFNAIPKNREIHVYVDSPGGTVWGGWNIRNTIAERKDRVTFFVVGLAASITSVILTAGKEVRMYRNTSTQMIHDPMGLCGGNAEDMRKMANALDMHGEQIAGSYAEKGKKTKDEFRALMKEETWLNAEKAKELGLCDVIIDGAPPTNKMPAILNFDLSRFQRVPGAIAEQIKNSAAARGGATKENTMNREAIIALLKEHGVTVPADIKDDALLAKLKEVLAAKKQEPAQPTAPASAPQNDATNTAIAKLQASVDALTKQRDEARQSIVAAAVDKAVEEGRISANEREGWITDIMENGKLMARLEKLEPKMPGEAPVRIDNLGEDPKNIGKAILALWGKGVQAVENTRERARQRAAIINRELGRLLPFLNAATSTNTVSADLKRTVILQQMIRAFAIRILPLGAFSTVFNGVRLQGTDKVAVPYSPLITTASEDFSAATGYNTAHNTNSDAKTITVDKRKYQLITWTSAELARQPFQDIGAASMLVGEQLGLDVVNNVLSAVLIAAFPGLAKSSPAGSFDSDDVVDIKGVCDLANWPEGGRSLLLNSTYDINLLKDAAVKNAMAFGDNGPIREGRVKRIAGFDYYGDARVPANAEALQGMAAFKSALLVAFAPVDPTEEVRTQLTQYELVIEPTTQAMFEYRRWGDADLDVSKQVVESNFGKVAGEAAAIQRVTS